MGEGRPWLSGSTSLFSGAMRLGAPGVVISVKLVATAAAEDMVLISLMDSTVVSSDRLESRR